jgi:hypothetical protein
MATWRKPRRNHFSGQAPEVAASILQSLESSQDQVQTWYSHYLHRAADPIGWETLSNALQRGFSDESAIEIIMGSEEHFARAG